MSHYYFLDPDAIRRVNAMFRLEASGREQDWEVELACADRRGEFFRALALGALAHEPEVEAAVAALYIASADDALGLEQFRADEDVAAYQLFRCRPLLRERMSRLWFQRGGPVHPEKIERWLR